MKIVVVGGAGLMGSKTVSVLRWRGYTIVVASRRHGVDTVTGDGLCAAMAGAQVVIDLSNSSSQCPEVTANFFEASSRNLLGAAIEAGVRHYVALSIVGCDRVPGQGHFRA